MSVSSTINRVALAGNGVTVNFPYGYKALAQGDFVVIEKDDTTGIETPKTLTTHYTVAGSGVAWTITMLIAPASGTTLTIYNDPSATQGVDLVENDSLPAETLEGALDRLTLIAQRLADRLDRSPTLSEGFSDPFDLTLPALIEPGDLLSVNAAGTGLGGFPTVAQRANLVLGFDATGLPVAVTLISLSVAASAYILTLLDDLTAAAARTTLGVDVSSRVPAINNGADYQILTGDGTIRSSGTFTKTLPDATAVIGEEFIVKKVDAFGTTTTIAFLFGQTADGQATLSLPEQFGFFRLKSTGTNYDIVGMG